MTPLVAITQRVVPAIGRDERRDALDQRWVSFLSQCGVRPLVLPNDPRTATALLTECPVAGLLLTTEAMIADAPKKDAGGPQMPGGGMGGMDM